MVLVLQLVSPVLDRPSHNQQRPPSAKTSLIIIEQLINGWWMVGGHLMLVGQLLLIVARGHNVKLIKNYDFPLWPGIRHVVAGSSSSTIIKNTERRTLGFLFLQISLRCAAPDWWWWKIWNRFIMLKIIRNNPNTLPFTLCRRSGWMNCHRWAGRAAEIEEGVKGRGGIKSGKR